MSLCRCSDPVRFKCAVLLYGASQKSYFLILVERPTASEGPQRVFGSASTDLKFIYFLLVVDSGTDEKSRKLPARIGDLSESVESLLELGSFFLREPNLVNPLMDHAVSSPIKVIIQDHADITKS